MCWRRIWTGLRRWLWRGLPVSQRSSHLHPHFKQKVLQKYGLYSIRQIFVRKFRQNPRIVHLNSRQPFVLLKFLHTYCYQSKLNNFSLRLFSIYLVEFLLYYDPLSLSLSLSFLTWSLTLTIWRPEGFNFFFLDDWFPTVYSNFHWSFFTLKKTMATVTLYI